MSLHGNATCWREFECVFKQIYQNLKQAAFVTIQTWQLIQGYPADGDLFTLCLRNENIACQFKYFIRIKIVLIQLQYAFFQLA